MDVRRLDLAIAAMVVLDAHLVRAAPGGAALPLGVLAAAAAAFWLTDVTGRFRLSRGLVNLGVIAIGAVTVARFVRAPARFEIQNLADALVCLQVVLLFEKKTLRTWWDLVALSVFLAMLSAAFSQGIWFGTLMAAWLFVVLSVLAMLFLLKERIEHEGGGAWGDGAAALLGPAAGRGTDWRRLRKVAAATLLVGPASLFLRYREGSPPRSGRAADPPHGGGQRPAADPRIRPVARAAVLPGEAGREFWRRMIRITLAALVVGAAVFVAAPRFGGIRFPPGGLGHLLRATPEEEPARGIGFSDRVQLGELEAAADNAEHVLDIAFFEHASNRRCRVEGNVYLRGAVLTRYSGGGWETGLWGPGIRLRRLDPADPALAARLVRQQVTIEPLDRGELFCVWPVVLTRDDGRLRLEPQRERLYRERVNRRFSFVLGTTAFEEGVQADLVPCDGPVNRRALLGWPAQALPGLAATARRWVAEAGLAETDLLGRARLLESRLRYSGNFEYALEPPQRDPALDPIEDFVVSHPRGNCEYFATALALMLRSQGIPSRIVVGYKCDAFDDLGEYYRVRQSHAHAWVEAYLAPEQLPAPRPGGHPPAHWADGGWLRLDPTPSAYDASGADALARGMQYWLQRIQVLWDQYVVNWNGARQREIAGGLWVALLTPWRQLRDLTPWGGPPAVPEEEPLAGDERAQAPSWMLGRVGWAGALVGLLVVLGRRRISAAVRRLSSVLAWRGGGRPDGRTTGVAFYRRLERILARQGLTRPPHQTQREFALQAGARLAKCGLLEPLPALPLGIVEAFYRVRFGGEPLDRSQATTVEEALDRLARAVNGKPLRRV